MRNRVNRVPDLVESLLSVSAAVPVELLGEAVAAAEMCDHAVVCLPACLPA
jgi:hypothetical protein